MLILINMDYRKTPLVNDEYYHIFNRGVARVPTFLDKRDYNQALASISYYRFIEPPVKFSRFKEMSVDTKSNVLKSLEKKKKLIDIICFALMPNHFHFILKQISDKGISTFLSRFTNSYTKFFNIKHERVGPLFQGRFKSVHVESDNQLIHLSRYIHLNPLTSHVIPDKELISYPWTSLKKYLSKDDLRFVNPEIIMNNFASPDTYLKFVMDQKNYQMKLKEIEHLTLES